MDEQHKQELLEKLSKAMPGTLYIKAGWSENSDGTMPMLTGSLSFEDGRVSLLDRDGWETAEMDAGFVVSVGSEGIRIVGVGYPVTGRRAYQEWLFVPGSDTAGEVNARWDKLAGQHLALYDEFGALRVAYERETGKKWVYEDEDTAGEG